MLTKILVLLAVGGLLTIWPIVMAYRARMCLHDPECDNDFASAQRYYGWLRMVAAMGSFVAMLSIMLITELTMDGMSTMWEYISIIGCVGAAILVMFATIIMEASSVARLNEMKDVPVIVKSSGYRHTN